MARLKTSIRESVGTTRKEPFQDAHPYPLRPCVQPFKRRGAVELLHEFAEATGRHSKRVALTLHLAFESLLIGCHKLGRSRQTREWDFRLYLAKRRDISLRQMTCWRTLR